MAGARDPSNTQSATTLAAELVALCQKVTADGVLAPDEMTRLREWLGQNEGAAREIPSIAFLLGVARKISADGEITPDERLQLQRSIELVLPREPRAAAIAARKKADNL